MPTVLKLANEVRYVTATVCGARTNMKYLVFQMDLEVGNPEENRKIIERRLEANYCDDLDVAVLP
ncbi:hypothetical protein AB4X15_09240 [Peribacillus simplex]|uniref:hypothetical protein n=1 Tax=Peribacillus TaxID=2675229 RepID=UPI00177C893E|nr:hypothetical protein [Brevibacillus sp. JNUCC-41]QOS88961.1 hypothetical protein JNUCC41_19525 [Brevibacillus sp. JNUCC-41]